MKIPILFAAAFTLCALFLTEQVARAQGTAFTYQGRLTDTAAPANGSYDFQFTLYALNFLGEYYVVGGPVTNLATTVSNGLFMTALDFGAQFPGAPRWLEVAVRTNGSGSFFTLSPRQWLTPAPYAITAGNVVSGGLASGTYGNSVNFNNPSNQFSGSFTGNGANVTNVNAATLNGLGSGAFWQLGGNNVAGGQFLGSANNQPLEIWANNSRALRLEPNTNGAPNVIAGSPANFVANGVTGGTVGGGGATSYLGQRLTNSVVGDFGTVGGGAQNSAGGYAATASGGIHNTASGSDATVSGGQFNSAIGPAATVAGGSANSASSYYSTVSGGQNNLAGGQYATVGGGYANSATNDFAAVGGGSQNNASGSDATVSGGLNNLASGYSTTVSGGQSNTVNASYATVGGGYGNNATNYAATVGGGEANTASGDHSMVGGGYRNSAAGSFATVGGGYGNNATNYAATVGGGHANSAGGPNATVGGGVINTASGSGATVGGGRGNTASGFAATVGGGVDNTAGGQYSFAAGNSALALHDGTFVWADSQNGLFSSTTSNQFLVRAQGGVGIGTSSTPDAGLSLGLNAHLNDNPVFLRGGTDHNHGLAYCGSGVNNYGSLAPDGPVLWGFSGGALAADAGSGPHAVLTWNGNSVSVNGQLCAANVSCTSDRNLKERFRLIDSKTVLQKVAALPITEWNFKSDSSARHIGPMAQDFYASFNVGSDDKHIGTLDEGGVALAAIQGLNQKVDERLKAKDAEIQQLKQSVAELKELVNRLGAGK